ncbi:DUF2975 domain-containing protein [Nocardiopsis nanhaiensis]
MPSRPKLRWSRLDSSLVQFVLILGSLLSGLSILFALLWIADVIPGSAAQDMGMNEITVHPPSGTPDTVPDVALTSADVSVRGAGQMVLTFHDPSALERLLLVLPVLIGMPIVIAVLYLVIRVLASLDLGDPFVPANVRRIWTAALLVIVGAIVVPVVEAAADFHLQEVALASDRAVLLVFTVGLGSVPALMLLVGFVLAAFGEVFRRGSQMRDDVEGLI